MGLLLGGVFALAYAVAGLPLGHIADRGHRRNLIVAGLVFWSLATASMAAARGFWDLLLARVALGIGEAALAPAAYSLIAAYFPPHQAARATSVYGLGVYLGAGLAVLVGGVLLRLAETGSQWSAPILGAIRPWQVVLLALGMVGPVLALLLLAIREPPRDTVVVGGVVEWALLKERWTAVLLLATGFALMGLSGYASSAWLPSYFVRTHGWTVSMFGMVYGGIVMVFGGGGVLFGGWLADRWEALGHRDAVLRVGLLAAVGSTLLGLWFLLPIDSRVAVVLLAPAAFLIAMGGGIWVAGLRLIVPPSMLGRTVALCLMLMTLSGLGLGPTLVGWLSHEMSAGGGTLALPLLIVCGGAQILGGLVLWMARRPYLQAARLHRLESANGSRRSIDLHRA